MKGIHVWQHPLLNYTVTKQKFSFQEKAYECTMKEQITR